MIRMRRQNHSTLWYNCRIEEQYCLQHSAYDQADCEPAAIEGLRGAGGKDKEEKHLDKATGLDLKRSKRGPFDETRP